MRSNFKLLCALIFLFPINETLAATRVVNSTSNDANLVGTLPYWLLNADDGDVINCSSIAGQAITLTASLPAITKSYTINGAGITIDGANNYQAFQAASGTIVINDVKIQHAISKGGAGGSGYSGGGGAVGGGGALYIHGGASLTIASSSLINNIAQGGDGGSADNNGNAGAGGGGGFAGGNGGSTLTVVSTGGGGGGGSGLEKPKGSGIDLGQVDRCSPVSSRFLTPLSTIIFPQISRSGAINWGDSEKVVVLLDMDVYHRGSARNHALVLAHKIFS